MHAAGTVRPFAVTRAHTITLVLAIGLVIVLGLDYGVFRVMELAPAFGKNPDTFALELTILVGISAPLVVAVVLAPSRVRAALPALFCLLAWHTGFQIQGPGKVIITVFDLVVPAAIFLGLAAGWNGDSFTTESPTLARAWYIYIAFCAWGVVLALVGHISSGPLIANLRSLTLYPLIAMLIVWCIRSWRQLMSATLVMLVLILSQCLIGLEQTVSGADTTMLSTGQIVPRVYGLMEAPNQYAMYVGTSIFLLLALIVGGTSSRLVRGLALAALPLALAAELVSFSRGGWIAVAAGMICLLILLGRRRAASVALVVVVAAILMLSVRPDLAQWVTGRASTTSDNSLQFRQNDLQVGIAVLEHYPLGAGWGAYYTTDAHGNPVPISGFPWYHDDYLQLATEIGIPGLAIFVAIFALIFRRGLWAKRNVRDPVRRALISGLLAALVAILIQGATDQFFWKADIAPHIWIVVGLVLSAVVLVRRDVREASSSEALRKQQSNSRPAPRPAIQPLTANMSITQVHSSEISRAENRSPAPTRLSDTKSVDRHGGVARLPLSVLVPCFNNEDIIEDCLRCVTWADEIVVVDSFSTDRTCEIAARYADRIIRHEYRNSATQKNWAIPQVKNEWLLIVDTDERVTPDLRGEIEEILRDPGHFSGFRIARANIVYGRWLRHGRYWPDYQLRLFRRDAGRYQDKEVHAHVDLDGTCGTLSSPFLHYPHRNFANMRRALLQRYTTWDAMEKQKRGVTFRWHKLLIRPAGTFVDRYIVDRGFLDGWQGLFMAAFWAVYIFITYTKLRRVQLADNVAEQTAAPA